MQIENFELRLTNRDVSAIAARLKRDTGLSHSKTIDAIAGALGFEGGNAMMSLLKAPKARKASAPTDPDASYNPFMDADLAKIARGDGAAFLAYLRSRSRQHNAVADYLEKHPEILSAPDFSIDCWAIAATALRTVSEEDHDLGAHYIGQEHYTAIRSDLAALMLPRIKEAPADHADDEADLAKISTKGDIIRDAAEKAGKPVIDIPVAEISEADFIGMPMSYGFGAPNYEPLHGTLEDFLEYLVSRGHEKVAAFLRGNPEAVRFSPEMEGSAPTPADWDTVAIVMTQVNFDDFMPQWALRVLDRRIGTEYREALLRHLRSF